MIKKGGFRHQAGGQNRGKSSTGLACLQAIADDIIGSAVKYFLFIGVFFEVNYNLLNWVTIQKRGKNQPLSLWRRVFLVFLIAAMAPIASVMFLAYINGKRLGWEVARISKAGEPVIFTNLSPKPSSPGAEDAADYYVDAMWQIQPGELPGLTKVYTFYRLNMAALPPNQFPGDLRKTVQENLTRTQPILAKLDKGAELELTGFDIGILHGNKICRSRLNSCQAAFFLLSLRTLDAISRGDSAKAIQSLESTLKLMRVFDSQPTMFVQTNKIECVRLVCNDVLLLLARCRLSEQQLAHLQPMLENMFLSSSLETMLLAERVYQLEVGRNLIPKGVVSKYLAPNAPNLPERLQLPGFMWHRMRVRAASVRYLRDMAWFIEASRLPWPESLDKIIDVNSAPAKRSPRLASAAILLSRLMSETLAKFRCTTTAVAIERYRSQKGNLPETLDAISPQYVGSIPLDPFTGKPLLYIRDVDSYTVYSTGFNRVDDKGSVTPKQERTPALDTGVRVKRSPSK